MKNLITLLFFISVTIFAQTNYNINLVINGNADAGDFSGWDNSTGPNFQDVTTAFLSLPARDGNTDGYIFDCYTGFSVIYDGSHFEHISQTINISDIASDISTCNVKATLSGYIYRYLNGATSRIILEQLDASDNILATSQVDYEGTGSDVWQLKSLTVNNLNAAARKLKIKLFAQTTTNSDYVDFDAIDLKLTPVVTFSNGSGFSQSITPGNIDQVIGRFMLSRVASLPSSLTAVTIKLNGTRSGLSNFKLWYSTDNSFNSVSDTKLGLTVAADPGDGNTILFNGFSDPVSSDGTYYFLTADVAAGATGTVQGVIVQNSDITIDGCVLGSTILNALLSNNTASLPVELTSFTATTIDKGVELKWETATEQNNYGFEILRSSPALSKPACPVGREGAGGGWTTLGFVEGHGTINSPNEYSFIDTNPLQGNAEYRLKQIDVDGNYKYYSQIAEVNFSITDVKEKQIPKEFGLSQNYPNPFNPSTVISYQLPVTGNVVLKVYDMLGKETSTLVNEYKQPGYYQAVFSAGSCGNASNLSTGVYIYRLTAGSFTSTKKLMLIK